MSECSFPKRHTSTLGNASRRNFLNALASALQPFAATEGHVAMIYVYGDLSGANSAPLKGDSSRDQGDGLVTGCLIPSPDP
jgi:hypothetical protein